MHYQPRDRSPIMDFGFWDETLVIWQDQGYPAGANPDIFFGMTRSGRNAAASSGYGRLFRSWCSKTRAKTKLHSRATV